MPEKYILNPRTNRYIKVGGGVYTKLAKSGFLEELKRQKKISPPKKRSPRSGDICKKKTKYIGKGILKKDFCGPSGGACPYTYPVNTPGRAVAALAYARNAPNPQGIKKCARRIAKEKGWTDEFGTIKKSGKPSKSSPIKKVEIKGKMYNVKRDGSGKVKVMKS